LAQILIVVGRVPKGHEEKQVEESLWRVAELSRGMLEVEELYTVWEEDGLRLFAIYRSTADLGRRDVENIKEAVHHLGSQVRLFSAREI